MLGKLINLENAVFQSTDRLRKRNGYLQLVSDSSSNAISAYNNELLSINGSSVSTYSAENSSLINKGSKIAVDLTVNSVVRSTTSQLNPDSASMSNLIVYAYTDNSGGARYSVFDSTTQAAIVNNTLISSTASKVKVRTIGTKFVIFFMDTATNNPLKYVSIDVSTPTVLSAPTTIDSTTNDFYDAQTISTRLFIAYGDGSSNLKIRYLDSALALSSALTIAVASRQVCVFGDNSNNVWVQYATTTTVNYLIRDFNLSGSAVLAPTLLETTGAVTSTFGGVKNVTGIFTGSTGEFYYELSQTNPIPLTDKPIGPIPYDAYIRKNTGSVSGTVGSPTDLLRSVGLVTKPFIFNSIIYVGVIHSSTLQPIIFIINSSGSVICKIAPDNAGALNTIGLLTEISNTSTGVYQFPYVIKDSLASVNGGIYSNTGISNAVLTFNEPISTEVLGENIHLSGGILKMYDGNNVVEHGFNLFPENFNSLVLSHSGGLSPGVYSYQAVYEWNDNQGQIHRSAPGKALSINLTTSAFSPNFNADEAMGSPTINNVSNSIFLNVGNKITGPGIPSDTRIIEKTGPASFLLSNNAGSTGTFVLATDFKYTFLAGVVGAGGSVLSVDQTDVIGSFYLNTTNGSPIVTVLNPNGLEVGMVLTDTSAHGYMGRITSISGNTVTLDTNLTFTDESSPFNALINELCSVSVGMNTVSSVPANMIALAFIGQRVYGTDILPNTIITAVHATSFDMSTNATGTDPTESITLGSFTSYPLYVGQILTCSDVTVFSGTFKITNIFDANGNPDNIGPGKGATIKVDAFALKDEGSRIEFTTADIFFVGLQIPTLRVTDKIGNNPAYIVLYRTVANGTIYYRTSSITNLTYNDITVDYVNFYDTTPDEQILGNDQLYTTGGELENIAAPAISTMTSYRSRMVALTEEDPLTFWYSKQVIAGSPVEFSDQFTIRTAERDGPIIAMSQMDDKLIIFKRNTIFFMVGEGPSPNGSNNDFSEPILVNSDTGCIDKKSVVLMPNGLMYKSTKGIYLLDRSLSVSYVGADVEFYNQYNITSSRLIEGVNQVRFSLSSGDTLTYDYYFHQWSVFKGINQQDSTLFQNLLTYIDPSGNILQESPGTFTDNGAFIPIKLTTNWFTFAGLQAFERVWRVMFYGDYYSPHSLQFTVYNDFVSTSTQTVTVPFLTPPTTAYQGLIYLIRQKCEALQLQIEEQQSASFGEGLDISGIAFEVGIKKGLNKLPASQKYG